ncbi:AAA family ATPase [Actinoplanes couchii]|nr:AAA family ATPase [Actinoplanes couchii]
MRIDFGGYRRLHDTGCNVDSKLIAFIGPNEAGKSSVLQGLAELNRLKPFTSSQIARRGAKKGGQIVSATFILGDNDITELAKRGVIAEAGTRESLRKMIDGRRTVLYDPPISRNWDHLNGLYEKYLLMIKEVMKLDPSLPKKLERKFSDLIVILKNQQEASDEKLDSIELAEEELSRASVKSAKIGPVIEEILEELRSSPFSRVQEYMKTGRPGFILYDANQRLLETRYDLSDAEVALGPPQPLVDVLALANLDLDELAAVLESGNLAKTKTLLKAGNKKLRELITPAWQQSEITLHLENEGSHLLVLVDELDENGAVTTLDERSDGLRAFLAMFCFVLARTLRNPAPSNPVILLLDEADRHLHYDAQADLVNVLMEQSEVSQVLYTTHSPGCLPPDLGTSVRLVEPDAASPDISHLRNGFWSSSAIGFSPLLVAMGAGAAAFSACRKAVLAEGATEMILLPTLIRLATNLASLDYQVAPGLSGLKKNGLGVDEIAARVAYLLDGDAGGIAIKKLLEATGVPEEVVVSLPRNKAIEDLVSRSCYLAAFEHIRQEGSTSVVPLEISDKTSSTLGKQIEEAAKLGGIKVPGKIAVANYLVQNPQKIVLTEANRRTLVALHESFCKIFSI